MEEAYDEIVKRCDEIYVAALDNQKLDIALKAAVQKYEIIRDSKKIIREEYNQRTQKALQEKFSEKFTKKKATGIGAVFNIA
jgi:hypothetical protein